MFARALWDLAAPSRCLGCGTWGADLCPQCRTELTQSLRRPWGRVSGPRGGQQEPPTWAGATYSGVVRELVLADKDRAVVAAHRGLVLLWRRAFAEAVEQHEPLMVAVAERDVVVVPVPSAPAARRRRGRDPCAELVRDALAGTGIEPMPALRVRRRVADQAGLSADQRRANRSGATALRQASLGREVIDGRICVLADDVVTTGATLRDAAAVLTAAGAREVLAVTAAATALTRSD
ncbi:ComF family protein [Dermacoccaceae bacterium W4C1]